MFVTDLSSTSDNCLKELTFALEDHTPVLAIHLTETVMPDGLRLGLGDRQAILKYELSQTDYEQKVLKGLGDYTVTHRQQTVAVPVRTHWTPRRLFTIGLVAIAIIAGLVILTSEEYTVDPATVGTPVSETVIPVPAATVVLEPSIAVLPFINMSNDPEQEFFSNGLSEDILNGLVNSSNIKVIARTSSFQFKGENQDVRKIGKLLAVTHILEGSVRKVGNRIRVTAQLIKTTDGTHLWSGQYDRQLNDVFEVQDEITQAILDAMNLRFTPYGVVQPRTNSMEAYTALLKGRSHLGRRQLDEAVDAFELAVALDPEYADAYAGLAFTHRFYVWSFRASLKEKLPLIRDYTDKALALHPTNREALRAKIMERFYVERDYQGAIDELHQQVVSNPSDMAALGSYATLLHTISKYELAISLRRRAVELSPLFALIRSSLAGSLTAAGQYSEAADSYRQAERLGLLFPELYEHPRYRAMLRKHRLDDESIAQLKVSSLSF